MREVWLSSNRRALVFALALPALGLALGISLGCGCLLSGVVFPWLGIALGSVSTIVALFLVWQMLRPRLAQRGSELLFYLSAGRPERVPVSLVEGFLLGQGASFLPSSKAHATQATTVVVRLAERAEQYARRDVRPALGSWCNHYVTIRGTWCEPLSVALVTRLNERLAAAHAADRNQRVRP